MARPPTPGPRPLYFPKSQTSLGPENQRRILILVKTFKSSDISQVFRSADILGVQQAIKGFDKPDFREVISMSTTVANTEVTHEYLKNDLDLIFTVRV